jgi:Uma2 family endonuclease
MSTVTATPPTTAPAFEHRIVLRNVPWDLYVRLRDDETNDRIRMTYCEGVLEFMSPGQRHEWVSELLGQMICAYTEEFDIPRRSAGSTTFRDADLRRGLEPDKCWYVQNEPVIRAKEVVDLTVDPPPDLLIEVEATSPLVPKLPILAALGMPEVWHWRNEQIRILQLVEGEYQEAEQSAALPDFPFDEALRTLADRFNRDETALVKQFRESIRRQS